nr:BNR-4 repeat-containing protein [Prolixibacteraceae bacterium]
KYGDDRYTYANPFCLSEENNRIYLFGRWTGFKPNVSWSDDGGETWSESRVVVCPQPFQWIDRPYVKYFSDGKEKIHLVFTDGHPRDEALNSVYYACYHHGAFFRSDGKQICTIDELPFEPSEATLVYDAQTTGHRAWVYDLAADEQGNPVVAYARYPSEWDHIYHYTRFNGDEWIDTELVHSGRWFPQTPEGESEREPHYSGGMALDPNHPGRLFLSRQINGIFEIEMWSFSPDDATWQVTSLTNDSENDQVRPVVARSSVRNGRTLVLWNSVDQYVHYTRFRTGIRMWIEEP